jgi:hypothetical protein
VRRHQDKNQRPNDCMNASTNDCSWSEHVQLKCCQTAVIRRDFANELRWCASIPFLDTVFRHIRFAKRVFRSHVSEAVGG